MNFIYKISAPLRNYIITERGAYFHYKFEILGQAREKEEGLGFLLKR